MQYFRLLDDLHIHDRWHLGKLTIATSGTPQEFWSGVPAAEMFPLRTDVIHCGRLLDFCLTSFATPVVTKKLGSLVASVAGNDVQRIPVAIEGHPDFEVLNSVRVITCLDERRSEFVKWTNQDHRADLAGQYRMVTKLYVDPTLIPDDAHFFRVDGWHIALIVSKLIKDTMQSEGCLGAKFEDVT